MELITIPSDILDKVRDLHFENPSDARAVELCLKNPEDHTDSILKWFNRLIERNGAKYSTK